MSETRKNHLNIDGGQVKEDGHVVDSYKPITETDTEFKSKPTLSKSKEKISDEAEVSLLQKEERPRITTNDMAEAKYVVGDQRNGDTKVHIVADGAKRQFSGLTQEELKKYADDPFWVRLRWFMFILFWALWLCMLAGAIAIIVRAPKCAAPPAKNWAEEGPLVDYLGKDYSQIKPDLSAISSSKLKAVIVNPCEDSYQVLDNDNCLNQFKNFLEEAKKKGIKIIVDLTANFVPKEHIWFTKSENKTEGFADFFVWAKNNQSEQTSPANIDGWSWSAARQEYYLNQLGKPDLNFQSEAVVAHFDHVLAKWMQAGASGVRLLNARHLVVNKTELGVPQIKDQPELSGLFEHFQHVVHTNGTEDSIFTIYEDGQSETEWYRLSGSNASSIRPPFANPIAIGSDTNKAVDKAAAAINTAVKGWPALKLTTNSGGLPELAAWAMLLPAAPVFSPEAIPKESDGITDESQKFSHLSELRSDASIQHGHYEIVAVPTESKEKLLACTRWKSGHTGYVSVFNPWQQQFAANLASLQSLPDTLSVHYMSEDARSLLTNFTKSVEVESVQVPPRSTVVLSYAPKHAVEQ